MKYLLILLFCFSVFGVEYEAGKTYLELCIVKADKTICPDIKEEAKFRPWFLGNYNKHDWGKRGEYKAAIDGEDFSQESNSCFDLNEETLEPVYRDCKIKEQTFLDKPYFNYEQKPTFTFSVTDKTSEVSTRFEDRKAARSSGANARTILKTLNCGAESHQTIRLLCKIEKARLTQ